MSRVVHFELHASQPQVLIDFYTKLLGWEFAQFGDNPYWAIITGTTGDGINGGLAQRQGDPPEPGSPLNAATIVVPVDNVDESYAAALADGGSRSYPAGRCAGGWVGWRTSRTRTEMSSDCSPPRLPEGWIPRGGLIRIG